MSVWYGNWLFDDVLLYEADDLLLLKAAGMFPLKPVETLFPLRLAERSLLSPLGLFLQDLAGLPQRASWEKLWLGHDEEYQQEPMVGSRDLLFNV